MSSRVVWLPLLLAGVRLAAGTADFEIAPDGVTVVPFHRARLESARVETTAGGGVRLRDGAASRVPGRNRAPDLTVRLKARRPGRYLVSTTAAADSRGKLLIPDWKRDRVDFCAKVRFDDRLPERLVIFVPWRDHQNNRWTLGKFDLTGEEQELAVQLPRGFALKTLEFSPCVSPVMPPRMAAYRPKILPPPGVHPRVWVTPDSLKRVRENLKSDEHRRIYEPFRAAALRPFRSDADPDEAMAFDRALCDAAVGKAFVRLLEDDAAVGKEAAALMTGFLHRVSFGNRIDSCREVGEAIYAASLVYDWCYDLLTPEERQFYCDKMLAMAEDLETGWPPVRQTIVNGHGNENQMCRDLLAMSIAIYDENPEPYRWLAYQVLEVLVPMKNYEYRSPRHNQGTNYGYLRYGCDLYAAWLMARMCGRQVFDPAIFDVIDYWTYMRLPGGDVLPDGDGSLERRYWAYPQTTLLAQAGRKSAQLKGEMMRQKSFEKYPMLSLLFNDPSIPVDPSFGTLPLTVDFGTVLGGMAARTGWDISPQSSDVIAMISGGGYHFGNHQHSDSGAFQIFYRGRQVTDLGQYHFYGTPYDFDFAKRSVAHSMMLVYDPEEPFAVGNRKVANDGGIALNQTLPLKPSDLTPDSIFYRGRVRYCAFGPDRMKPPFSAFSVDLTGAYGKKVEQYTRSFYFLNLGKPEHPAAVIVLDRLKTARPEYRKYLQINSQHPPEITRDGIRLHNRNAAGTGLTHISFLLPEPENRSCETKTGLETCNVFGEQRTPPKPKRWQMTAARSMVSPKQPAQADTFLTIFQMTPDGGTPQKVDWTKNGAVLRISLADRTLICHARGDFFRKPFEFTVPHRSQCMLADLAPGVWRLANRETGKTLECRIEAGRNVIFFPAAPGVYHAVPPE